MSEEKKKPQKGIPIENENVSKNPNRSPRADDSDKNVDHHHEDYVEPYNKQKYEQPKDPKQNQ